MRTSPQAHQDYPATFGDFSAWFRTDEDCRDYLRWLKMAERVPAAVGGVGDRSVRGEDPASTFRAGSTSIDL